MEKWSTLNHYIRNFQSYSVKTAFKKPRLMRVRFVYRSRASKFSAQRFNLDCDLDRRQPIKIRNATRSWVMRRSIKTICDFIYDCQRGVCILLKWLLPFKNNVQLLKTRFYLHLNVFNFSIWKWAMQNSMSFEFGIYFKVLELIWFSNTWIRDRININIARQHISWIHEPL